MVFAAGIDLAVALHQLLQRLLALERLVLELGQRPAPFLGRVAGQLHPIHRKHLFESQYCNDETGAPAYDPAILLKIVLYVYSKGITSSREIAQLCQDNVMFMALSADTAPHFTTIANFVSRQQD